MAKAATLFISNRLQRIAVAILCLAAAQLVLASCTPEPTGLPTMARVAVTR
jgi:hypothetical protein